MLNRRYFIGNEETNLYNIPIEGTISYRKVLFPDSFKLNLCL